MVHRGAAKPMGVLWVDTVVAAGSKTYRETGIQVLCLPSNPTYFMLNTRLQFPNSFLNTAYESYSQKLSENHDEALKRLIA